MEDQMRGISKLGLIAAAIVALAFAGVPQVANAMGGMGASKSGKSVDCKSGAKVKDVKQCKEHGGKR
jgi:hypothetical protein